MKVRLVPGATVERAQQLLNEASYAFQNVRGAANTPHETYVKYVEAASTQVSMLSQVLPSADLDRVLTTPRYWMLQVLDPSGNGAALAAMLNLELNDKVRILDDTAKWLGDEKSRFAGVQLIVVPDTNFLLQHSKPIDQFPWRTLTTWDTSRHVLVAIPIRVVDELDRAKRRTDKLLDGKTTVRTRARVTLATLEGWLETGGTRYRLATPNFEDLDEPIVDIEVVLDDPDRPRLPDADYEIIDQARALKDLTGARVVIATFDRGMRLRARAAGVEATMPSDLNNEDG